MSPTPLATALLLALGSTCVSAQNDPYELEEVLVSATRVEEAASQSSRSISVIDEEELALTQPQSVPEALSSSPNITTTNGPRVSSQGVEIRGLSGTRVLQTIDGARQNTTSGHRGVYFMDPEMLQSVEVIRGPASSLWGSGAIGGVVAQVTRNARDFLEPQDDFGGYLKQGFEFNGDRQKTSGAVYGQQDQIDWLINASYFDSNNIKTGDDLTLENSGGNGTSGMFKLGWQENDNHRLEFNARLNEIRELVPSNPATNVGRSVPLVKRNTKDTYFGLDYTLKTDNPLLDMNALVYLNDSSYKEDRVTRNQKDDTEYRTFGISVKNTSEFDFMSLTYGLDGYKDELDTVRDDSGQAGQRPANINAESTVWGGFVQAGIPLGESLLLTPAVRYDSYDSKSEQVNRDVDDSEFSPSVALVWDTTDWLTLSARYDQAFRAPGMEEMFSTGSHYCIPPIPGFLPGGLCNTFKPNPDLKSETARNKELKAYLSFADLAGDDELNISLNLFRNDVDDFIVQQVIDPLMGVPGLEQTTTWSNVQDARLQGFELVTNYRIKQTWVSLSYGQTEGKDKADDSFLEGIPADKFVLDLSQGWFDGDFKAGTRLTYVAEQKDVPADFTAAEQYDSYTLWDLYLAWEPSSGALTGLRIDAGVDNITDEYYQQAWQTLYQQGRNIKLNARYMF
ncbi:TonB-dependent hemoglobin/transferrin/lactoferrin family receptor [Shewanella submarina]|uniref:TonB-dependent hemoglobin/transferrin/lactoferrin family receptor n=1 Tax=Shewanella submarina TaxID=2016376 RepID=A0ABV7GB79_9GAMM|nr:TonB-dependent hemoglobin/transferrin/lactoferrin family receptor [Shewanella submarina]MCL1037336.1 TonB-dependent hemoglobin/transferrin/lactoferrin family receptor [Shewanella submarina]